MPDSGVRVEHVAKAAGKAAPTGLIEKAIAKVAPQYALKRMAARTRIELAASFGAGGGYRGASTVPKALSGWNVAGGSATSDLHPDLDSLRERSRDLERNAPIASGAISTTVTSTVGTGIRPHPEIDREFLGMSDEQADDWELEAKAIWSLWADSTMCDLAGESDFATLQAIAFRSVLASGDILSIHRFKRRPGDIFGSRVQLIEADRISNPQGREDTARLSAGVQINGDGLVQGYHVRTNHPGELYPFRGSDFGRWKFIRTRRNSGHRLAWLLYKKTRPGQVRGAPFLAPVIEPLKQLETYTLSELQAAAVAGMFTVFVTSDEDDLPHTVGAVPSPAADDQDDTISMGYGLVVDLKQGEDIKTAAPERPNTNFDEFVTAIIRQIGMALEIPHEVLTKHYQASYSAARAALLDAWKLWKVKRSFLGTYFGQPCYEQVIGEAVALGLISAPGFLTDPMVRAAYLRCSWVGDGMPNIDPQKEINARKTAIEAGLSTREREAREHSGVDYDRIKQQLVREADDMKKIEEARQVMPLTPPGQPGQPQLAPGGKK